MDGGRRILRSLRDTSRALALGVAPQAGPAFAGLPGGFDQGTVFHSPSAVATAPRARARRPRRRRFAQRLLALATLPGLGAVLALGLVGGVGLAGAMRGGEYAQFVAENGDARDVAARLFGFGIAAITINGAKELAGPEVLAAAGINPRGSVLFLDVAAMRQGLVSLPLVKEASVRKLYPNQIVVDLVEREPYAVWQKDGVLKVVAADGTAIDDFRDDRFIALPFVVGDEANTHLPEYLGLLDVAGDLKQHIRAGIYVGARRWDLKLDNGVVLHLPEIGAADALRDFAKVARDNHVLDKDVIAIDLRIPGRLVARLSEEAAAARAEMLSHKKGRGGA